ncbi:MAG: hypothetical protein K6F52_00075 [Clostridia bacterium]|nr:hypothetical protein [Clostridia bacterium]
MSKRNQHIKQILSVVLVMILLLSLLTSCGDEENLEETAILNAISNTMPEVRQMLDIGNENQIVNYLTNWAAARDSVKISHDEYGNIIMSSKATSDEYKDGESVILHCSLDFTDTLKTAREISTILYVLDKSEEHGFIRAVFTHMTSTSHLDGAEKISKRYIEADNLLSLDWEGNRSILVGSAGTTTYKITDPLSWNEPKYPKAYEIKIKGLPGGSSADSSIKQPNAIKLVGDLLATLKSKSILYELAGFNGGDSAYNYPQFADIIIVINQNDNEKFISWVENAQEKFEDKYGEELMEAAEAEAVAAYEAEHGTAAAVNYKPDIEPPYSFTCNPVELPSYVMSDENCNRLVSFLYAMPSGTYLKSEEGRIVATTNLGKLSTKTGTLILELCARSMNKTTLDEITTVVDTVCGLSDVKCEIHEQFPVWEAPEFASDVVEGLRTYDVEKPETLLSDPSQSYFNRLSESITRVYDNDTKRRTTFKRSACAIFHERVPEMNVLTFGLSEEKLAKEILVIMDFLKNINNPLGQTNAE